MKYEYNTEELCFYNGSKKIYGFLYTPKCEIDNIPTVIICHGFGCSHLDNIDNATNLVKEGYACYIFDFCGGSPKSKSDGDIIDMSVLTEVSDLTCVIEQIRKQRFVDEKNIFLMGQSQGGFVAAITAANHVEKIRGLVLEYPAFVIPDDTRNVYNTLDEIPDEMIQFKIKIGKRFHADVMNFDAYKNIVGYNKNVLIIHGDCDRLVPISYSQKAVEVYTSAKLITIKGAKHGFYDDNAVIVLKNILKYLNENLEK